MIKQEKDWEIIGKKGYTVQVLQYGRVFNTTKETAKRWLDTVKRSDYRSQKSYNDIVEKFRAILNA